MVDLIVMPHEGQESVEQKYHLERTASILAKYWTQTMVCMR